jgi:hypothetical protein
LLPDKGRHVTRVEAIPYLKAAAVEANIPEWSPS